MPKAKAEEAPNPPHEDKSSRGEDSYTEVANFMLAPVESVHHAHVDPTGSVDTHQRAEVLQDLQDAVVHTADHNQE